MPEQRQDDGSPSRNSILRVLQRRLPILILCSLLVPAAALAASLAQEKQYSASASLLFRDPGFDQSVLGSPFFAPPIDAKREAATNMKLVSLDVVADRTARAIGSGLTGDQVRNKISISPEGQADLVSITAKDRSPKLAARLATTFAEEYIAFRRESDRTKIQEARRLTRRQLDQLSSQERDSSRRRLLKERVDQLETLASLQTGNAELVQRAAVPASPASPRPVNNTILGLLLGLALGVALALIVDRLDRRLREPDEMEEIFRRPILAVIPQSRALARAGPSPSMEEAEAFRMLRANLRYFNVDQDLRSVLVTSAAPGDGKSTVAANLATAAASTGARVLLLEADLRHPSLAGALDVKPSPGLTQLLARGVGLSDVVQTVSVPRRQDDRGSGRTFDVVAAGPLPPNPTDLMESARMRDVVRTAARNYDLVVVDTPPAAVVSDAIPLVNEVKGVIVVGRIGKSIRSALIHLNNQLEHLGAPTLGVVVNGMTRGASRYGYGYRDTDGRGATATAEAQEPSPPAPGDGRPREATEVQPVATEASGARATEASGKSDAAVSTRQRSRGLIGALKRRRLND